MLTVQEIESACDASQDADLTAHPVEAPKLTMEAVFYPYGFPIRVRTNSPEVLAQYELLWEVFEQRFDTEEMTADVHVIESDARDCPPSPSYRLMYPLMVIVADGDNYAVVDLSKNHSQITISPAALRHPAYLRYFLLECAAGLHLSTRYATPVHAACVSLDGRGVLLCGDSGAGKSSLSYACARWGWGFVADDACFLLNGGTTRTVVGNCHQIRLRPSASELFPEIAGYEITPRAEGKPSIELPTAPMSHVTRRDNTQVDFVVFLNRRTPDPQELVPYRADVARHYMRQTLFGSPQSKAAQCRAIDRLLTAEIFELRYSRLDWAVRRLQTLVLEGR